MQAIKRVEQIEALLYEVRKHANCSPLVSVEAKEVFVLKQIRKFISKLNEIGEDNERDIQQLTSLDDGKKS
jgi:hypothetical protein